MVIDVPDTVHTEAGETKYVVVPVPADGVAESVTGEAP